MQRKFKFIVCLLSAVLLVMVMYGGCHKTGKVSEAGDGANRPKRLGGGPGESITFDELLPIGAQAPDFSLETLEGETVSLQTLRGKTVVLVTGSRTCPHFLIYVNSMDELYKAYRDRDDVQFLYLYTREPFAETFPGYSWSFRDVKQPETYEERKEYANMIRKDHGIDIPILIGPMDGAVHKAYGNQANSVVIIDSEGKIAARDKWNDPLFVELTLRDMVTDPPEVEQVETMLSCEKCHEDRVKTIDENPDINCDTCHSLKKARRDLKSPMDRSHRKTPCDARCHNVESVPPQIGPTGSLRDLFVVGAPPLYEEPGLSFTHMSHINSGRFAYLANFHVVSKGTQFGSCRVCHSLRGFTVREEKCTKCHGANPHKFHEVFEGEMKCHECHTTPGKPRAVFKDDD